MFRFLEIIWSSLKMALAEFNSNKLRTFLSLFGITVGIFCIIGVLATVDSLAKNVKNDINKLGTKTIYIERRDYSGQIPWWKVRTRPQSKYEEMKMLKQRSSLASNVAFFMAGNTKVEWNDDVVTGVNVYGCTEDFSKIQQIDVDLGRYLQQSDFDNGTNNIVIGYSIAEKLFTKAESSVGQEIELFGKKGIIIGLIRKQGASMLDGFDFDNCMITSYGFLKTMVKDDYGSPLIIVQGHENIPMAMLRDDVEGAMRSIRKLRPEQANNFSMNDVEAFGQFAASLFSGVNLGGWFIAGLSLLVGMFGVANIMFVTVRERTSQIGLKKAIGAKRSSILVEFLLESAFLCILGGLIGLLLVFILTKLISSWMGFPIFISFNILSLAITICIVTGVLAGIIPAFIAARMDPVVAIRSK